MRDVHGIPSRRAADAAGMDLPCDTSPGWSAPAGATPAMITAATRRPGQAGRLVAVLDGHGARDARVGQALWAPAAGGPPATAVIGGSREERAGLCAALLAAVTATGLPFSDPDGPYIVAAVDASLPARVPSGVHGLQLLLRAGATTRPALHVVLSLDGPDTFDGVRRVLVHWLSWTFVLPSKNAAPAGVLSPQHADEAGRLASGEALMISAGSWPEASVIRWRPEARRGA